MPLDTRNCFWFGTEDRAGWFSTPLKGSESSPSAWGVDGTLLNGGGYGYHSWGSHKRYTYEWPQSSSPQVAQLMKSYRDGTYGRGLLYFLEPGIYKTNVLPAAWADPSMAVNNEGPSLVYGVTPTGITTSGGSGLDLPITTAQYDLSSIPVREVPTPDSSVFIPVPTGYTLFLGAFYTATGSAGIFASPINSNGTIGEAVRLTEMENSSAGVVTDPFSGDIRGVRIWVGRTTDILSTISITAMCGRLIETSDVPEYGPWTTTRTNLETNPATPTLTPISSTVAPVVPSGGPGNAPYQTVTTSAVAGAGISKLTAEIPSSGDPRRISAMVRVQAGSTFEARARYGSGGGFDVIVPYVGTGDWQEVGVNTTAPGANAGPSLQIRLTGAARVESFDVTLFTREAVASRAGEPFYGSTNPNGDVERTQWTGPTGASTSVFQTRTKTGTDVRLNLLKAGPWIGGQGHSGCRFLGTPSYVNNGPVEGGRVGFAASFEEVGSWVYG